MHRAGCSLGSCCCLPGGGGGGGSRCPQTAFARACSAPAQRGEKGGGCCRCCCSATQQDTHTQQGLPRKLKLPCPPTTAASATGSGSPRTPAGGQRKTSGDLNWRMEKPCHENCTTFFPGVAANPSTPIVPGQSLSMGSPFWHWSTRNAPHHVWSTSSPMLCQQGTQNRATDTMAGSPGMLLLVQKVPTGLQGSPRGSGFLPLGWGGWLPPHLSAARPTRGALHPAATPQPSLSYRFSPTAGMC